HGSRESPGLDGPEKTAIGGVAPVVRKGRIQYRGLSGNRAEALVSICVGAPSYFRTGQMSLGTGSYAATSEPAVQPGLSLSVRRLRSTCRGLAQTGRTVLRAN